MTTDVLLNSNLVAEGYFRPEAIMTLLNEHVSGKIDHNYRIWLLLNLELWHRLFINRQPKDELKELLQRYAGVTHRSPSFR